MMSIYTYLWSSLWVNVTIQGLEEQKNEALNVARVERTHAEELAICLKAAREEINFLKQQQAHSGPAVVRDGARHSRKSSRRSVIS